jgi:hypothetical protein
MRFSRRTSRFTGPARRRWPKRTVSAARAPVQPLVRRFLQPETQDGERPPSPFGKRVSRVTTVPYSTRTEQVGSRHSGPVRRAIGTVSWRWRAVWVRLTRVAIPDRRAPTPAPCADQRCTGEPAEARHAITVRGLTQPSCCGQFRPRSKPTFGCVTTTSDPGGGARCYEGATRGAPDRFPV